MQAYSAGDVNPQRAVQGLLAQGRTTAAALYERLLEAFPDANYAPNTALKSLPRLAAKGFARIVQEGEESSQDVYEITEEGLLDNDEWIFDAELVPTPLRDPVQGKLAFIGPTPARIDQFIKIVELFEKATSDRFGKEQGKLTTLNLRGVTNSRLELQRIRLKYTASKWGGEAKRLTALRKELEEFKAKLAAQAGE
jgi:DNA-binding PadR family transcriptional regulator